MKKSKSEVGCRKVFFIQSKSKVGSQKKIVKVEVGSRQDHFTREFMKVFDRQKMGVEKFFSTENFQKYPMNFFLIFSPFCDW